MVTVTDGCRNRSDKVQSIIDQVPFKSELERFTTPLPRHLLSIVDEPGPPRHKCDIDWQDIKGNTILMAACQVCMAVSSVAAGLIAMQNVPMKDDGEAKQAEMLRQLLTQKADVNMRNRDGQTALHLVVKFQYNTLEQVLLDAGADPGIK